MFMMASLLRVCSIAAIKEESRKYHGKQRNKCGVVGQKQRIYVRELYKDIDIFILMSKDL
jgi:hypothetical protein